MESQKEEMTWLKENIGKVITAVALLFSIIGFLADRWMTQVSIVSELEKTQLQIQYLQDDIKDLKSLIQNKVLTKAVE